MGICCSTLKEFKSNIDDIFDELLLKDMSASQINDTFQAPDFIENGKLLQSNFLSYCDKYCLSRTEFNRELLLYWIRFYENHGSDLNFVKLTLIMLSTDQTDKLSFVRKYLVGKVYSLSKECPTKDVYEFVKKFVFCFTLMPLSIFSDVHESRKKYEYEYNVAFTHKLIVEFIEYKFFEKFEQSYKIDYETFFDLHFKTLSNIGKLRQDLIEFSKEVDKGKHKLVIGVIKRDEK